MASPPEMNGENVPATVSNRAALPSDATVDMMAASLAPVTVLSALTTTWLLTGSTAYAVPAVLSFADSVSVVGARGAPRRATRRAVAPEAVTDLAVAGSVTSTTILPAASM